MKDKRKFLILFIVIFSSFTTALMIRTFSPPKKIQSKTISFTLINSDTDQPMIKFDPMENGTTLNLNSLPTKNLNIRVNTEPVEVGSVVLELDIDIEAKIENSPPYSLAGDSPPGDYHAWTPSPGRHVLTATPYTEPDGKGTSGTPLKIYFNVQEESLNISSPSFGQLIVDPKNPSWFRYDQGGPYFMCGPGDPEDFLYRGSLNPDGTRNGDQSELIAKLKGTGANCIYLQAIRSHGGDGDHTHNPFVDNEPTNGVNQKVLEQWESWFTEMDQSGITIFFFIYDDGSVVWDTGDKVSQEERSFIHGLVDKFQHQKHLIWVVNEEYGHAYSIERISNIAKEIRAADHKDHPISVHHHSDAPMGFPDDPNIDQYAMQWYSVYDREDLHNIVVDAWEDSAGRYNLNMAEANLWGSGTTARKKNWACAMGGAYVMILGMDIKNTPISDLEDCGRLVRFMESTNFDEMTPHDELAFGGTEYVLANPSDSYIAYSSQLSGDIGLRDMSQGFYDFKWYDITNGNTIFRKNIDVSGGDQTWPKPPEIGNELVVYLKRTGNSSNPIRVYPSNKWEQKKPEELGIKASKLDEIVESLGGDGCIIKDGYLVKTWGSQIIARDWASSSKPVLSTLLLFAVNEGKVERVDSLIKGWGWELVPKDEGMTFRHLANMMSGYARPEKPGEAYAYNDRAIQLYYNTLEKVFNQSLNEASISRLNYPLQLEGSRIFNENGHVLLNVQDFARICWFWLNKGEWDGQQLLPKSYFNEYMTPGVPIDLPYAPYDRYVNDYLRIGTYGAEETSRSTLLGPGIYGFNWWFNAAGRRINGTFFDLTWPDAPKDTIMTVGVRGHNSVIIPSLDLLLVSAEGNWQSGRGNNDIIKLLAESVSE